MSTANAFNLDKSKILLFGKELISIIVFSSCRFYDAEGMGMKFCPECNMSFSADIDEQTFEDHQLSHIAGICPVCKMMKDDNMSEQDFTRHVNKHYENEEIY